MPSSYRLGRIAGIEVGAHWSWFLVFFLLSWSLATTLFRDSFPEWTAAQRWLAGVITTGLFFASVLLHELSHSLVARRLGLPVSSITLFIFGGVSNLTREPDTPRDEFVIAIVGPGTSFLLAAAFALVWAATRGVSEPVALVSGYLAFINGVLGVFNMVPGFPLDGGRVFRSIVWARNRDLLRATRIASGVGVVVAYGLVVAGIAMVFTVALISGIWLVFIGWFLKNASESSYQQLLVRDALQGVPITGVTNDLYTAVAAGTTLRELADRYILPQG
ncbi:MAG: site-2 protease family protein, partial [Dehalococcoidia bacterium]